MIKPPHNFTKTQKTKNQKMKLQKQRNKDEETNKYVYLICENLPRRRHQQQQHQARQISQDACGASLLSHTYKLLPHQQCSPPHPPSCGGKGGGGGASPLQP